MKRDDRLILLTWIAFAPLAVLASTFGLLLVLFPGSTRVFWAWEIRPAMSAVWVGAGYTFGGIAITAMLTAGSWRASSVPVIGTWPFSVAMLVATLLHIDRFFTNTPQFYVWFIIYVILPFALPVVWWLNRGRDPGPQPDDMLVPRSIRLGGGAVGVILALLSLLLFFGPSIAASFWPWQLTPLMSRVISGWLSLAATGLLCLFFERRYIAYRLFVPCAAVWTAILFVASLYHLDNFDFSRAGGWVWFALAGSTPAILLGLFLYLERRYRMHRERKPVAVPEAVV